MTLKMTQAVIMFPINLAVATYIVSAIVLQGIVTASLLNLNDWKLPWIGVFKWSKIKKIHPIGLFV